MSTVFCMFKENEIKKVVGNAHVFAEKRGLVGGAVKFMGNYVTRDSLEGHFYFGGDRGNSGVEYAFVYDRMCE